jgi:F-type H+-transporting ATPase subunit alpha
MSMPHIDPAAVTAILERNITDYSIKLGPEETGRVLEAGDGIARVNGLSGVMSEEMLLFPDNIPGMAMNLERDEVRAVILGDHSKIEQGDLVKRTCNVLQVPVGEALLGRVVNTLGQPIDGKGPISDSGYRHVETHAPGIAEREPVSKPLRTGLKSVDSMTAIGRGQRELIIGDRQTGKSTLAIDAILNQKSEDVRCIYVAIGQKMSTVAAVVDLLTRTDALGNCLVVVATASDPAPLQYIAPFAACTMAEYFRDAGQDALIVYDDLSKHAVAYRELCLVLHRPPGREAFPGDIFYLHSRLLERAAKLHPNQGGGSLTALPIVETQQGDYSAYIPTNLISITDGQIYLESSLFHQGFRPAMNVGLSVSRVGGHAQMPAMKKVAIKLRIDLAQYREVASFTQFTSDLDPATMKQIHTGERLAEILKQEQHMPMPEKQQVCVLWAAVHQHLDNIPLSDVTRFQHEWILFLENAHQEILSNIQRNGQLTDQLETQLLTAMTQFTKIFVPTGEPVPLDKNRVVPSGEDSDIRAFHTAAQT